jgi:creatinine amidohydrolase/Fe(II)-dependent formamide hydrolase-like protein
MLYNKRTPMVQHELGLYPTREDWTEARRAADISSSGHDDMHAGEVETSVLRAAQPNYLRDGWQSCDHTAADRRHLTALRDRRLYDHRCDRVSLASHRPERPEDSQLSQQAAQSLITLLISQSTYPSLPWRLPSAPTKS